MIRVAIVLAFDRPEGFIYLSIFCTREFAESRVGQVESSICALDLMAGSVVCLLAIWSREAKEAVGEEVAVKVYQDIGEMWPRLLQGVKKVCLDQREDVRNDATLMLQKSLTGVDGLYLPSALWLQYFDLVIFVLLDNLLEVAQGSHSKDYRNMDGTLILALRLLSKVFLQVHAVGPNYQQKMFTNPRVAKNIIRDLSWAGLGDAQACKAALKVADGLLKDHSKKLKPLIAFMQSRPLAAQISPKVGQLVSKESKMHEKHRVQEDKNRDFATPEERKGSLR